MTSCAGVLRRADAEIRGSSLKTRNNELYKQAVWVFEFVVAGKLELDPAVTLLKESASAVGLSTHESTSTLRSAYRKAGQNPTRRAGDDAKGLDVSTSPPPPRYPPADAVKEILGCCTSVLADPGVCAYLEERNLDPERVSRFGRALSVPVDREISEEAAGLVPKRTVDGARYLIPAIRYRLLIPLVNPFGKARSVLFRRCFETDEPNLPKSMSLLGQRARLVMANRAALALLERDKEQRRWWGEAPLEVVIAEGEMDFLTAATEEIPDGTFRAVLGIVTGSWCESYARAIPPEAKLTIAVDNDDEDEKFTNQILRTLGAGRACLRWKPTVEGQDLSEAGGLRGGNCYEVR